MKIGLILPNTRTGESRYSDYLINGLKENGINIEILNNPLLINRPNVKIFMGSFFLKRIIKNRDISVVHNLDNLGPFLVRNNKIKSILTVHDIAPVILPQIHSSMMNFNFKWILPKLIDNCDSIIADNKSTKNDLISKFGVESEKINVVPLGIDTSIFYSRPSSDNILKKYGINHNYLIYVGGDNPRKNLKNLILAFIGIFQNSPHDLVLIGPINKKNLVKIIKSHTNPNSYKNILNRIIIPGYVDYKDLPVLYSAASAFVFPSLYEGFGLPLLESMACGTPVITSSNSSLREVVGNSGLYINDPLNPNEISDNIIKILDNDKLRNKLKNRGFERVKKFSWEETTKKTIKTYEQVVKN
jgi:glycosyltransferase involved in cell wall biosynthesis